MKLPMNRRHFLRTTLASTLAIPAFVRAADSPYRDQIGLQLYTLRRPMENDAEGTIRAVAEAGYHQVEAQNFRERPEILEMARDNGLVVNSSHFTWQSVTNPEKEGVPAFDDILEDAREAGLTHLVIPYLDANERRNLDDYRLVAERCNDAAARAKEAGIQLAYHNHAFEFEPLEDGKSGYDVLAEEFAPEMMFEIDVFWVAAGGHDPVKWIEKLAGRTSQLHLKDLKEGIATPNYGKLPDDAFQELGDGVIPMAPILAAAADAGVVHCHVEQDQSPDPVASIRQSYEHLETL